MNADIRRKDLSVEELQNEFKTFKDMLYILGINVDIKPLSIEEKEIVLNNLREIAVKYLDENKKTIKIKKTNLFMLNYFVLQIFFSQHLVMSKL